MPCSGEMDEHDLWIKRGSRSLNREVLSTLIKKQAAAVIHCSCNETQRLEVERGAFGMGIQRKFLVVYAGLSELGVDTCCKRCGQLSRAPRHCCLQPGSSLASAAGWDPFPIARFPTSTQTERCIISVLLYSCLARLHRICASQRNMFIELWVLCFLSGESG